MVQRQLEIAGITLAIESIGHVWDFETESKYHAFEVSGQQGDVRLSVHWQPLHLDYMGDAIFSARAIPERFPPNWQLFRNAQGLYVLQVNSAGRQSIRHRIAVFEPDFRHGDVFVEVAPDLDAVYPYPLRSPLDRVLFVNVLTHGLGVMLHACGVVLDGKGYVFAGPSDAGKTTLSRLWADFSDATILGDECLILRRHENRFWVYGTPWVGEAGLYSPRGVPVEGLFFVHHADQNQLALTPLGTAAERLLAQSLLTPYDAGAVEFGLDFCLSFVSQLPAFTFGFVPDESAVQFIQGHLDSD